MPSFTCPKCLGPSSTAGSPCVSCRLIEQGLVRNLAQDFLNTAKLTCDEAGEFDHLTAIGAHYGQYELPDTVKLSFTVSDPGPTLEVVGGGLGLADPADARAAIAKARGSDPAFDQARILAANAAWTEMEEKALDTHKARRSESDIRQRLLLAVGLLAGLGGLAVGVGLVFLILLAVGR